jgi:hypothetical protein
MNSRSYWQFKTIRGSSPTYDFFPFTSPIAYSILWDKPFKIFISWYISILVSKSLGIREGELICADSTDQQKNKNTRSKPNWIHKTGWHVTLESLTKNIFVLSYIHLFRYQDIFIFLFFSVNIFWHLVPFPPFSSP